MKVTMIKDDGRVQLVKSLDWGQALLRLSNLCFFEWKSLIISHHFIDLGRG